MFATSIYVVMAGHRSILAFSFCLQTGFYMSVLDTLVLRSEKRVVAY